MSLPKNLIKKQMNGHEMMKTPFIMLQAHPDDYYDMSEQSLNGIRKEPLLSKVFFSQQNINLLQKRIITEVLKTTNGGYLIEKQNENDLLIVMQLIYSEHAKHLHNHIRKQISDLNDLVLDEIVPSIVSELKAYFGYLNDVFGPRKIMDRPENVSKAGLKILPSETRRFDF